MASRVAFVFPGQGSQRVGMLYRLPHSEALPRLLDAAEALTDMDLRAIAASGPEEQLTDTRVAQPLLYLADWCWGTSLISGGIHPKVVAGHSLGELAALAVAGVFSPEAGLELVVERSKLMATTAAAAPGAMAAVLGMQRDPLASIVEDTDGVWIANDNSEGQIVISGTRAGVETATSALMEAGARRVVPLAVAGAFHSPLMEPARLAFEDLVRGADFRDASVPVISNTVPSASSAAEVLRERLISQITSPVRWTETMAAIREDGPVMLIEAGPGNVLTGLAKRLDDVTAIAAEAVGVQAVLEEVSR